jgi:hypothetical protein
VALLVLGTAGAVVDGDGDGIADETDNCDELANPDQLDSDADGLGNRCDNCARAGNHDQLDADEDGVGDPCDQCALSDPGDLVDPNGCGLFQHCPCEGPRNSSMSWPRHGRFRSCVRRYTRWLRRLGALTTEERREIVRETMATGCGRRRALPGDRDGDGIGDDGDESGVAGDYRCAGGVKVACDDNCPGARTPRQLDADDDRIGDVCDLDRDGDGIPNDGDNCPGAANADQADADFDEVGDACDACADTPEGEEVDVRGCSESAEEPEDSEDPV